MTEEGGENWSVRQIELNRGYGFHCTCQACSLEDPEFESEEELRENLKQLQMAGAKNWDKGDVSEYLEGMGRLQGNVKHVMDVLAICFQASKDQVVAFFKGNVCYRHISGSQTGIRSAMPCTGPLHLRPWIARGSTNHPCFSHSSFLRRTVGGRSWRCCNCGGIATFFVMVENDLNLSFLQRDQKIHSLSQNNMKYTSTKKTGQSTHYRG